MILLVTSSVRVRECVEAIERKTHHKVMTAATVAKAISSLERHEFEVLMIDESILQIENGSEAAIFSHAGTAMPIYVNLALHGFDRVAAEVALGLQRLARERSASMRAASNELKNQVGGDVTAILLNAELALQEKTLTQAASQKIAALQEVARTMRQRLDGKAVEEVVSSKLRKPKSTTDQHGLHG